MQCRLVTEGIEEDMKEINQIILKELGETLRNNIRLISSGELIGGGGKQDRGKQDSKIPFFIYESVNKKMKITKGSVKRIPDLIKTKKYFFIGKESRKYINHFKKEGLDCVVYTGNLASPNINKGRILIKVYEKIKRILKNIKIEGEFEEISIKNENIEEISIKNENIEEISIKNGSIEEISIKEIRIKHSEIGEIHSLIINNGNEKSTGDSFMAILKKHFIEFYSEISPYSSDNNRIRFFEISHKYVFSIFELLIKYGILKSIPDLKSNPGFIMKLFPFAFYNNLLDFLDGFHFVVGGVCLDDGIIEEYSEYFNVKNVEKYTLINPFKCKKFVFTGTLTYNNNNKYDVEIL